MDQNTKNLIFFIALAMLASGCGQQTAPVETTASPAYGYSHRLRIGNQTLLVEFANTSAQMRRGLSYRNNLADDNGMLFDFTKDASSNHGFWMKDMKFNLDIIWIYKNKIVGITPDVPAPVSPSNPLPTYTPPNPVDMVLEVNAGWAKKNKIETGAEIKILD